MAFEVRERTSLCCVEVTIISISHVLLSHTLSEGCQHLHCVEERLRLGEPRGPTAGTGLGLDSWYV